MKRNGKHHPFSVHHRRSERISEMAQRPFMPGWIEARHALFVDDDIVAKVVRIHGSMEDANIRTDPDQMDFRYAPCAQQKIQIRPREGAVPRLVHPMDILFPFVVQCLKGAVKIPARRPSDVVGRE